MKRMPVLFVGHGSPMNAIQDNIYTERWVSLGERLPRPEAILSVSAHWFTSGTKVCDSPTPKTVYDMLGFPKELYEIVYAAPGSTHFAHAAKKLIERRTEIDNSWGLDHGTWSVLHRVFPKADIPVFQLSVDKHAALEDHYRIGRELRALREQGVLILGSGNVVHNLTRINWDMAGGYPWAEEFDGYIKTSILSRNDKNVINFERAGVSASFVFTTLEHFAPLLYVLGAADEADRVSAFNDSCVLGSLSMTGYLFE